MRSVRRACRYRGRRRFGMPGDLTTLDRSTAGCRRGRAHAGGSRRPTSAPRGAAGGRGRSAVCRTRRRHADARVGSGEPARSTPGRSRCRRTSTRCSGARPARRSPKVRASRSSPRPSDARHRRRCAVQRIERTPAWKRSPPPPTRSPRDRPPVALVIASDALPARAGHRVRSRGAARARRRRPRAATSATDAAATLGARVTRTRPFVDRYRGDGENRQPRPLRRAAVPRGDLPPDRRRGRRPRLAVVRRRRRGRSPIPTAGSVRPSQSVRRARGELYVAVYERDRRHRCRGRVARCGRLRSTRRASSRSSGPVAVARPAC